MAKQSKTFTQEKLKIYWDKQKVMRFNSRAFRCEYQCLKTKIPEDLIGKPYQVAWCSKLNKHCNFHSCPIPEKII